MSGEILVSLVLGTSPEGAADGFLVRLALP